MKKHLKLLLAAVCLFALSLNSCKKDEEGKTESTVNVKLKMDAGFSSGSTSGVTWNYALLNIHDFNVRLKRNGNIVGGNALEGPRNINMLANNDGLMIITFRTYEEFDELEGVINLKPSAQYPPLTLKAMVTIPSGAQVPVEFYFNDEASLDVNVKNMGKVNMGNYEAIIHFEVNKLFSAIDYSKLPTATTTNGKVIISSTSNPELYQLAKAALNSSYNITLN